MEIEKTLGFEFFGNTVHQYWVAGIFYLLCLLFIQFGLSFLFKKLTKIAANTKTEFDNIIVQIFSRIPKGLYALFFLLVTLKLFLSLEKNLLQIINGMLLIFIIFEVTKIIQAVLFFFLKKSDIGRDKTSFQGVKLVGAILLWATAILMVLSNLGFNISALAASLGIGGIAIALALQNILGDLFASFTIYFDKPFQIGDYIILANTDGNGTQGGTVQKIGLKTTRIKTLQGEELVVSNKELTETRVRNFKQLQKRRVSFSIGVVYETSPEKLEKIPGIIEKILKEQEMTTFLRTHFESFGDFSLNFETVYMVNSNLYDDFMDMQQVINMEIVKVFKKEKIEMAFPTQTIYTKKS